MKVSTFQAVAARYAAVVGRSRKGVTLSFGGPTAWTNGQHINIPALPAGSVMTPWQVKVYYGYIDHEAGHVRFTDFKQLPDRSEGALIKSLTNIIEDVREENLMIAEYPGARRNLDALTTHVDRESEKNQKGQPETWAQRVLSLIYKEVYAVHRDVDSKTIKGWLSDYRELKGIKVLLDKKMPRLRTTLDATNLARELEKLLPKNLDYASRFEPSEKPMSDEEGDFFIIPVAGSGGAGQMLPEQVNALAVAAGAVDGHEAKRKIIAALMAEINAINEKDSRPTIKSRSPRMVGDKILPPLTVSYDRVFVPSGKDASAYLKTRSSMAPSITALKKMLNIYLRSRRQRAWSRGLEEGKLDTGALYHLVSTGSVNVMKERRAREMVNTAVELVVDCSGSMDDEPTRGSAIIMAEALTGIPDLKLEICGFTTNNLLPHNQMVAGGKGSGRAVGMDLLIYKGFDESYMQTKDRLGAIECTGATPLGDAYGYAFERLLARSEKKKVLWIISDGDPSFNKADRSHSDHLLMARVKEKCRRNGIQTIGLYVGSQEGNLREYVEKYMQVSNCSAMPHAVLGLMKGLA